MNCDRLKDYNYNYAFVQQTLNPLNFCYFENKWEWVSCFLVPDPIGHHPTGILGTQFNLT